MDMDRQEIYESLADDIERTSNILKESLLFTAEPARPEQRDLYDTEARRDTEAGRGRFDLLPVVPLVRLAKRLEAGAAKYGERNWEKGIPVSRCYSSAMRHLLQAMMGNENEDHLAAVLFNVCAIMHVQHEVDNGRLPDSLDDIDYRPYEKSEIDKLFSQPSEV